ncbi:hypothetical protein BWQ96_05037 [Gracilariopsis chorda]|uniref:Chitin-binding type-4 domain-containing protein n=1 Tax=Gracilariopsis chorda TaxID=448386 RepID=A0A2V3IU01_9FLOR|nr:hypothetical protein BWQ96_05037 [Gracilariopsis chorda]|eukprot:PXF45207.1 hypothetical protein BWQ96_05037 [Gracilariopsis chorda]
MNVAFLTLCLSLLLPALIDAHGLMDIPRQRGAFRRSKYVPTALDSNAPQDFYPHFPAGVKDDRPGAGKLSQEIAAGDRGWYPYDPYKPDFTWRAGVCGDPANGNQDHLKGGKFYYDGRIVATYRQGGVIGLGLSVVAHHNGFVEAHVCDVAKCEGGDISKDCFQNGGCVQLKRAYQPECESRQSVHCGPIDHNYPGRWYLPCSTDNTGLGWDYFPPEYATFRLPDQLHCEHCVLQWYWVGANTCNPPGVLDYYDGPYGPLNWGTCRGQGGAQGGVTRNKKPCGGTEQFAEEYYQCADIRIERFDGPRSGRRPVSAEEIDPSATPLPSSEPVPEHLGAIALSVGRSTPRAPLYGEGKLKELLLWADNIPSRALTQGAVVNVRPYDRIGVEAVLNEGETVDEVKFTVDGDDEYTAPSAPYFLFRDSSQVPFYWKKFPVNREVTIRAESEGDVLEVTVTFSS